MISSVLVLNLKGDVLIHRAYRDDVSRQEALLFSSRVVATKEAAERPPVQALGLCHFIHVTLGDVIFVASSKTNTNATLALKFLYRVIALLKNYFGGTVDENSVRKNFVLIYELLDEVMDFGLPQILEADVLKKCIIQGGLKSVDLNDEEQLKKITIQATGNCSWRAEGIKYRKNEVYIDVIEHVNVLVSQRGQVLRADVAGQVIVKCLLSGMPECKFGMNDKLVIAGKENRSNPINAQSRSIALDDVRFHQCVRLSKFDLERAITFIPPDGTFELMTYRITENSQLPFKLFPVVQERGRSRLEVSLKVKATFSRNLFATNVIARIPCPKNAARATIGIINSGRARFEPDQNALVWRIRRFPGDTEYTLLAEVELAASVTEQKWSRPPIGLDFQVPMFTSSGLCVRFLRIQEKSNYKPVKWIRYITKAGSYQHRI